MKVPAPSYPVSVHYSDVVIVFFTVLAIGWLAVWYPVRYLSRRLLSPQAEDLSY